MELTVGSFNLNNLFGRWNLYVDAPAPPPTGAPAPSRTEATAPTATEPPRDWLETPPADTPAPAATEGRRRRSPKLPDVKIIIEGRVKRLATGRAPARALRALRGLREAPRSSAPVLAQAKGAETKRARREAAELEARERLADAADKAVQVLVAELAAEASADRIRAAAQILDRAWGRPRQAIEANLSVDTWIPPEPTAQQIAATLDGLEEIGLIRRGNADDWRSENRTREAPREAMKRRSPPERLPARVTARARGLRTSPQEDDERTERGSASPAPGSGMSLDGLSPPT